MSKLTNNVGNLILFIDVEVPAGDIKRSTFIEKLLASPQRNLPAIVGAIIKTDFLSSNAIEDDNDTDDMMTLNPMICMQNIGEDPAQTCRFIHIWTVAFMHSLGPGILI